MSGISSSENLLKIMCFGLNSF